MKDKGPALERTLSLPTVAISGIGIILGAGVYALIGEAASLAGNALWLSFLFSALIAAFTGLSYMELSSMFTEASAEYEYTRRSFGGTLAFIIGIMVILSGIVGAATVALGFAGYFSTFTGIPLLPVAFAVLVILSAVIFSGIKQSAAVAIVFTLIEAGGIVGMIIIGLPYIGSVDYLAMPLGIAGVFQASALIFFAYQGFEEIVKLSEENVEPERTIPKGLMIAVVVTVILYIAVSISIVSIGGYEAVAGSKNPFAMVAENTFSGGGTVFTIIALFATANTALLMMLASSRILYGMAKRKRMPGKFAWISPRTKTPVWSVAAVLLVSLVFLLPGEIRDVALIANFTLFFTFAVINTAVIVLRFKMPEKSRPYRVPFTIGKVPVPAVLGIFTCLFFLSVMDPVILGVGVVLTVVAAAGSYLFPEKKESV
ncbi:APC family permease [Methanolacinia petrolearia]|uniref:APC family permease n=1 Tax=Methanolacinia petrolearia TaxID=54120 RepID=UPI003BACA6A3